MTIEKERLMTVDEFDQWVELPENRGRRLELINGEIVEKVTTEEHGEIAGLFVAELRTFVVPRKLGRGGVEISHRKPNDKFNDRMPDVSFISGKRPRVTQGSVSQMPDLAIEIKSPSDTLKSLREKANYYLANDSQLVWIVDPGKRLIIVLTADDEQILLEHEILIGGDVLRGFSLSIHAIFADPLADD